MSEIVIKHLGKTYPNGVTAVEDVNIHMGDGEFVVLLGPSGCGKSTILMMLAGLEEITAGEVYFGDVLVNELAPKDRDMGLVFQSYALLPNMTVYDNIGFGLTIRKMDKKQKDAKIREAAKILGLEELLDRKPKQLSGGQKQRVAIGRSIVRNPKVFLFDEPLSNLDAKLRVQMRKELIRLHQMLGTTIVYVTHDQVEAMTMATKIVIMKSGRVQQIGTPEEVFNRPANLYVATFIGSPKMNILSAEFCAEDGTGSLQLADGTALPLDAAQTLALQAAGKERRKVLVGIRPERLNPAEADSEITLHGKINMVEMMGAEQYIYARFGEETIIAKSNSRDKIAAESMNFTIRTSGMVLFDAETEERIPT